MTPSGSMVLSGTKALEYSGSYGAPDERAIGGFCTAGSQGHAAFYAEDIPAAWRQVRAMLELGATSKMDTRDDVARSPADVVVGARGQSAAMLLGPNAHPARREQYAVRPLMKALFDSDSPVLFPWDAWADARQAIVARGRIGGVRCTLIGVDQQSSAAEWSHSAARGSQFHAGTLYPESSKKIARAIRAAADEPVVLLANLAGFDSSPESLLDGQLSAGAEIAGAVATRTKPLLVCVLTRYHGGAFVVFSKRLGADVTSIALRGSFASVIGGVPAAAIVFSRDVDARVAASGGGPGARGEALKEVGQAFDEHHSVDRALRMGSIDRIIELDELRASLAEFTRGAAGDETT
jgi:acetyl-CoA carboxylase carboxyltransferase component